MIAKSSRKCTAIKSIVMIVGICLCFGIGERFFPNRADAFDGEGNSPGSRKAAHASSVDANVLDLALNDAAEGLSTDEVLIRDRIRNNFLESVANQTGLVFGQRQECQVMLDLLQARKAGKLSYRSSRRAQPVDAGVQPIAEIAARVVMDRHRISSDTMLADPVLRQEFLREAKLIHPAVEGYSIRKSILTLRKKRSLQPELVLRVAQWDRKIVTWSIDELKKKLGRGEVPHSPGVYLFRLPTGYLYIGETNDLAERLGQHVDQSDRRSLADFLESQQAAKVSVELHLFPPKSPASKVRVRRAYESELIRSRNPQLNVRP